MTDYPLPTRTQRPRRHGLVAALILLGAMSCGTETSSPPPSQKDAPASASTQTGGTVRLADMRQIDSLLMDNRGRWILVNVWATWCRPCVIETPDLVSLNKSLAGKPFTLVGLSVDLMTSPTEQMAVDKVGKFRQSFQIDYPLLVFTGSVDELTGRFSLSGSIPSTILYDPAGKEAERWVGKLSEGDLARVRELVS